MGSNTELLGDAAVLVARQSSDVGVWAAMAAMFVGIGVLVVRRARLAGTTLQAPIAWLVVALACVGCQLTVELQYGFEDESWIAPLRFVAATSMYCPVMAVLGAKRPQNRAWQFVVLSLWAVLVLPAAKYVAFWSSTTFELHPARSWFLLILIVVGLVNFLPTRFWPAATLFAGGQVLLLGGSLPFGGDWFAAERLVGFFLIVAATLLITCGFPPTKASRFTAGPSMAGLPRRVRGAMGVARGGTDQRSRTHVRLESFAEVGRLSVYRRCEAGRESSAGSVNFAQ